MLCAGLGHWVPQKLCSKCLPSWCPKFSQTWVVCTIEMGYKEKLLIISAPRVKKWQNTKNYPLFSIAPKNVHNSWSPTFEGRPPPPPASPPCPLREERPCLNNMKCHLHNFWNYGIRQLHLLVVMKTNFFCDLGLMMVFLGCRFLLCHWLPHV